MSKSRFSIVAGLVPLSVLALVAFWLARGEQPAPSRAAAVAAAAPQVSQAAPRAVVPDNVHDLGVMNPGDVRRHGFIVRNEGNADLELTLGSTVVRLCSRIPRSDAGARLSLNWYFASCPMSRRSSRRREMILTLLSMISR